MPDQTSTSPAEVPAGAASYDSTKTYEVTLKRAVEWPVDSGFYFLPRDHQAMNGAVCTEIANAISSAIPVE